MSTHSLIPSGESLIFLLVVRHPASPFIWPVVSVHKYRGENVVVVVEDMMCVWVLQRGHCGDGCDLASTVLEVHTVQRKVREKHHLSQSWKNQWILNVIREFGICDIQSGNFDIYPNMYSTYGYGGDHGRSVLVAIPARQQDQFT